MADLTATYLLITGATTARRAPGLVAALVERAPNVLTVLSPNATRVVSPRELSLVPGHRVVESYFDEAILPRPPLGVTLVAPCTFNSLNKLALGIADTLALSIAAEAIGRRTPVIVAVSVNGPLWTHPRAAESVATLRSWGVRVLEPVPDDNGYLAMAPNEALVEAVMSAHAAWGQAE